MKKLHMGTVAYAYDSMDEVAHQLAMAFGASTDSGTFRFTSYSLFMGLTLSHP